MARKYYRKLRYKRKPRYKRKYKRKTRIPKAVGFPTTTYARLRFTTTAGLGGTALSHITYRANSLYDPDYAVGGIQPMYFDNYSAVYTHYRVIGAKITCSYMPSAESHVPLYAGIRVCKSPTAPSTTSPNVWNQQANTNYRVHTDGRRPNITAYYSPKKFLGIKDINDTDDIKAPVSASPASVVYFMPYLSRVNGLDTVPDVTALVTIEYLVQFSGLKAQQSLN